ncbi:hypothetical protein PIROE2DRAFT_3342, partial [Piromyces sp. E2]
AELTSIINKRKRFEYFLARRIPKKIDFLRYIEFELNLDALRKKRKERIIAAAKANQKLLKSKGDDKTKEDIEKSEYLVSLMRVTLSDYSILRHVHSLYNRALKRFPGDVELWIQYLEWAQKSSNSKLLGKVFPRVISLHPTKDIFWVMAASWEFEKNGNALSGRTLLQRGLRINGESKKLWLEYFRLELLYLEKLRERRKILFGKTNENNENGNDDSMINFENEGIELPELELESQSKNSSNILQQKIAELAEKTAKANAEEVLHPAFQAETDAQKAFFSGAIPKLIYKNAINAIKNDLKFRLDFIRIYNKFGKWTSDGIDEIYESIKEDFKNDEEAQAILCERFVNNVDVNDSEFPLRLKMSIDSYEKCISEINNKKIYQCYKEFLQKYLEMCEEENLKLYLDKSLQKLYQRAQENGMLSEEMYLSWLDYIEECDEDESTKDKQQINIIKNGLKAYPNSSKLLYQSLSKEMLSNQSSLIPEFEKAIKQVNPNESYELWDLYLNYLKEEMEAEHIEAEEINNKFKNTISNIRLDDVDYENFVLSKYLEWSKNTFNMTKFRSIVKDLIQSKERSLSFFEKCIEIEVLSSKKEGDTNVDIVIDDIMDIDDNQNQNQTNMKENCLNNLINKILNKEINIDLNKLDLNTIGFLFEKAINKNVTNIDLWLAYVIIEMKFNKSLNFASELYVRALNELKYNASDVVSQLFEKRYQEIKNNL